MKVPQHRGIGGDLEEHLQDQADRLNTLLNGNRGPYYVRAGEGEEQNQTDIDDWVSPLVKSIWNQVVPGKFNLVRDYSKAENTFKCQAIQDQPAGQRNQKSQETHCWEISTNQTSQINIQCYWFPHPPRQNIGSTWCQQMFAVIFDKSHFGEVKVIWSRFCHKYDPDLNFSVQPEVGSTRWKLSISVNSL